MVEEKSNELLARTGPPPIVTNEAIILARFPKCTQETEILFLLGNYIELVDKDVVNKQKKLQVDSMQGVLEAKIQFVKARAVPQLYLNLQ